MKVTRRLVATVLFAAVPAIGADTPAETATGTFRSQSVTLSVKSAIAFHAPSFIDKTDAVIVAVSNARLNPDTIADYVDRRRVLEKRVKDGETGLVYFEFKPDGAYRGMSYYFGPGNGCGYCTGEVTANTKLSGGKLSGRLVDSEKERSFDFTFVASIMSDEHGSALPPDGGEPGKAFAAYHQALAKADRPALRAIMSTDQQQYWSEVERKGKLGAWIHSMADAHPTRSVDLVNGYATAGKAVLLIAGESVNGKVVGEVLLVKEADGWRVDDEITEAARQ
jgi:hypothetical protein